MPGTPGRKARLLVSVVAGGAGAYNTVLGIESISHSINGGIVDDSEMTVDYVQSVLGLLGGKISATGKARLADATGQQAILAQQLAGAETWIKVLPDGGTTATVGFKQQVIITKVQNDAAVAGGNTVSYEFEGTGPITLV